MRTNRAPRNRFVGREDDLRAVGTALADGLPCVTVVGPPGVGKTRLVHEYVARTEGSAAAPHAVASFCDLSTASDADSLRGLVAAALELAGPVSVDQALAAMGSTLLVLDNAETCIDALAACVRAWVADAPEVQFLVTSRRALDVPFECVLPIGPLRQAEAEVLWIDRVRHQRTSYAPAAAEMARVARTVEALDGLPLAIELAAARSAVLGAADVLDLLRDRFGVLRARRGASQSRFASLEDCIALSWGLVPADEQVLLARCTVFPDRFGSDDARAVLGDDPGLDQSLKRLAHHFLLSEVDSPSGDRPYRMLQSIRDYASRHLARETQAQDRARHLAHVAHVFAALRAEWEGAEGDRAPVRMRRYGPDVLAALRWVTQASSKVSELALALELVAAAAPLVDHVDPDRSALLRKLQTQVATSSVVDPGRQARALLVVARDRFLSGELAESGAVLEQAVAAARMTQDPRAQAEAKNRHAHALIFRGALEDAQSTASESIDAARRAGSAYLELEARCMAACAAPAAVRAQAIAEVADEVANAGGRIRELASDLAFTASQLNDPQFALGIIQRFLRPPTPTTLHTAKMMGLAALCHLQLGDLNEAARCLDVALPLYERTGVATWMAKLREVRGLLRLRQGRVSEAADEIGLAVFALSEIGHPAAISVGTSLRACRLLLGIAAPHPATSAPSTPYTDCHVELFRLLEPGFAAVGRQHPQAQQSVDAAVRQFDQRVDEARTSGVGIALEVVVLRHVLASCRTGAIRPPQHVVPRIVLEGAATTGQLAGLPTIECRARSVLWIIAAALVRSHLAEPSAVVTREALCAQLWPDADPTAWETARRLRANIHRLREVGLHSVIETTPDGWRLEPSVDVEVLGELPV